MVVEVHQGPEDGVSGAPYSGGTVVREGGPLQGGCGSGAVGDLDRRRASGFQQEARRCGQGGYARRKENGSGDTLEHLQGGLWQAPRLAGCDQIVLSKRQVTCNNADGVEERS